MVPFSGRVDVRPSNASEEARLAAWVTIFIITTEPASVAELRFYNEGFWKTSASSNPYES
jgi:hypothetical protein